MKRILFLLILIISVFVPTGCSCGKEEPTISATRSHFSIALNQTVVIDDLINVTGAGRNIEYVLDRNNIISIENGVVTPLTSGNVTVDCRLVGYEDISTKINVHVRDIYLAKSATIPKDEIIINIGNGKQAINKPIFSEKVTEIPNVICDTNIVGYDYASGTVTARAQGETTVKIVFELCSVEFKVIVQKIVYVNYIQEISDKRLYVGDKGAFEFGVYPSDANQYRFYTHSDSIKVEPSGEFIALAPDTADIYCEYYTGADTEPVILTFKAEIYALPDNLNFSIVDEEYENIPYIFKGETNKILFDFTEYELLENFTYSNNIEVLSSGIETDLNGNKFILFKALESGLIEITISCNREIENIDRTLSKTKEIRCYDYSDIETIALYQIYIQDRVDDTYRVFVSDPDAIVDELTFAFKLETYDITDGIKLYLMNNGKQEISNTFKPTAVGNYTIGVEYNGNLIDEFVVVAV